MTVLQMAAKIWAYLGFGRTSSSIKAPVTPSAPPMEELDHSGCELDISRLTECPICMNQMTDPKFLPCHHTFCLQCIQRLCPTQSRGLVSCPLCRSQFNVRAIDRLPTNVYVAELTRVCESVSGIVQTAKEELAVVKNELKVIKDGQQKAADEKLPQDFELKETKTRLNKLTEFSTRVKRLKKRSSSSEQLMEVMKTHCEIAESKAKSCQEAKVEAEASLATAIERCCSLNEQLELRYTLENSLQVELRKSKEEVERLKILCATEFEKSKHVKSALNGHISDLNGHLVAKQRLIMLLMLAVVIFYVAFVANCRVKYCSQTDIHLPECS